MEIRKPISDRYATTIIDDPMRFDAIEVHRMRTFSCGDGLEDSEIVFGNEPAESHSVFVHLAENAFNPSEGGIDCCGDFTRIDEALIYASELSNQFGWPIFDFTADIKMVGEES